MCLAWAGPEGLSSASPPADSDVGVPEPECDPGESAKPFPHPSFSPASLYPPPLKPPKYGQAALPVRFPEENTDYSKIKQVGGPVVALWVKNLRLSL